MRQRVFVRMIAAQVPAGLRAMRGRMMLETVHEFLGVDEVPCPACAGSGWLSRRRLERCPLCCGFREVPVGLADWFRVQTAAYHDDSTGTTAGHELQDPADAVPVHVELGMPTVEFSPAGPSS